MCFLSRARRTVAARPLKTSFKFCLDLSNSHPRFPLIFVHDVSLCPFFSFPESPAFSPFCRRISLHRFPMVPHYINPALPICKAELILQPPLSPRL